MTEAEHYFVLEECYQHELAQSAEIYQIEGEYKIVSHFIEQLIYQWDLDHDYCVDA